MKSFFKGVMAWKIALCHLVELASWSQDSDQRTSMYVRYWAYSSKQLTKCIPKMTMSIIQLNATQISYSTRAYSTRSSMVLRLRKDPTTCSG